MSIRAIARDLYKAQQKFDAIQKEYSSAGVSEKVAVGIELEIARKELEMLRRMLEGEKDSGEFRKRFDGFGSFKR